MSIQYPVRSEKDTHGGFYHINDASNTTIACLLDQEDAEEIINALNSQPSSLGYETAITTDWDKHNERRHELIEAKRSRSLSESETDELRELQWLAGLKRQLGSGPPPVELERGKRKTKKVQVEEALRRSDLSAQLAERDDIEWGHHESLPRGEHVARLTKQGR